MNKVAISAIVLAQNEASMLPNCLKTLTWCKEIILIDDGSTDSTAEIGENAGARVISFKHDSFSRKREEGAKHATNEWLLYVDSDERISPKLATEIQESILHRDKSAFRLVRENIFYGKLMRHGGWEQDSVTRLIKKDRLQSWIGEVHESPEIKGSLGVLKTPLLHFSHRSVSSGLKKSAIWTAMEAQLLFKASKDKVTFLHIIKKGFGEFWRRAVVNKGYQDGGVGLIESLTQAINRMLVYMQIWELQQSPTIEELYAIKDREVEILWEQFK